MSLQMSITLRSIGIGVIEAFEDFSSLPVQEPSISNQYERFQLWAVNLGLLQTGHASLDWRLRNARNVETVIVRFLTDLKQSLQQAKNIIVQQSPYQEPSKTDQSLDEDSLPDDDDLIDAGYGDLTSADGQDELDQCLKAIDEVLGSLFKILTQIRNPSNRRPKAVEQSYQQLDPESGIDLIASYAYFDGMFIVELFQEQEIVLDNQPPTTPAALSRRSEEQVHYLVPRILTAMTARRKHFGYLQKHKSKSIAAMTSTVVRKAKPEPIQQVIDSQVPPQNGVSVYQQSLARESLPATATTFHVGNFNLDDSQTVVSISEYAPTARGIRHDRVTVPPPPILTRQEQHFECPYCLVICSRKYCAPRAWRSHVLRDLQPYICTYEKCSQEQRLFASRREWKAHEEEFHRKLWRCLEHRDQTFLSAESYRKHIQTEHAADAIRMETQSLLKAGASTSTIADRPCPICGTAFEEANNLQDHIAAHLERIAVFCIPRRAATDDDTKSDGSAVSDAAVQRESNASQKLSSAVSDLRSSDDPVKVHEKSDENSDEDLEKTLEEQSEEESREELGMEPLPRSSKIALSASAISSLETQLQSASPGEKMSGISDWVEGPTLASVGRDSNTNPPSPDFFSEYSENSNAAERGSRRGSPSLDDLYEYGEGPVSRRGSPSLDDLYEYGEGPVSTSAIYDPLESTRPLPAEAASIGETLKQPYIFIAHTHIPVLSTRIPHLKKRLKMYDWREVRCDVSGYFITFEHSRNGQMEATRVYEDCDMQPFLTYTMNMELHLNENLTARGVGLTEPMSPPIYHNIRSNVYDISEPAVEPDTIYFKYEELSYNLSFEAYSISEGLVKVETVRRRIADVLDCYPSEVSLSYKGRLLESSDTPIREYGCKQNSELLVHTTRRLSAQNIKHRRRDRAPSRRPNRGLGDIDEPDYDAESEAEPVRSSRRRASDPEIGIRQAQVDRAAAERRIYESRESYSGNVNETEEGMKRWRKESHDPDQAELNPFAPRNRRGARDDGDFILPMDPETYASLDFNTPGGKVAALRQAFASEWLPESKKFLETPPSDPKLFEKEYRRLGESIMQKIVLASDSIDLDGDQDARAERKRLILHAQYLLKELDDANKNRQWL